MAWIDPQQLTDEQLEAEINALEPMTIEFGRLNRRRWELIHEMGARRQRAERKAELAQDLGEDFGMANLIGKKLALVPDVKLDRRANITRVTTGD